jgi:hypothetical protein
MAVTGITNPDLANRLINAASDLLERRCNRKFLLADLTEDVKGYGTDKLRVERPPVKSVTSIIYNGTSSLDITDLYTDADAGLLQLQGGFQWTAHFDGRAIETPGLPGTELPLYVVTYQGGWITPQYDGAAAAPFSGGARDLPSDIEEACLSLVRYKYGGRNVVRDPTVTEEKLRTWGAKYNVGNNAGGGSASMQLPADVLEVIASYQRAVR